MKIKNLITSQWRVTVLLLGMLFAQATVVFGQNTLSAVSYTDNQLRFVVNGTANGTCIIQVNTNLTTPTWVPILTNTAPFSFTDAISPNRGTRFYRALYLPAAEKPLRPLLEGGPFTGVYYGVNFLGDKPADLVTNSAGVVAMTNWNNIANATMTNTTPYVVTITNSTGSQTATLTLSGPGLGVAEDTHTLGNGGDTSLMDGLVGSGWVASANLATNVISGLPSGQAYNVYIYCFAGSAEPQVNGNWLGSYSVNGTSYYVATLGSTVTSTYYSSGPALTATNFAQTGYVPATLFSTNFETALPSSTNFGDYFVITNVVATNGVITIISDVDGHSTIAPLNGFELVALSTNVTPPPPSYGTHFIGGTSDPVTGSAGVVPVAQWNNITNSTFTYIWSGDGSQVAALTLSGPALNDPASTGTTGNGGDTSLMDGYLFSGWVGNAPATLTNVISGLPSGAVYNLYIYCFANDAEPQANYNWLGSYSINGTTYFVPTLGSDQASTYYSSGPALTAQNFAGTGYVPATLFSTNFEAVLPSSTNFGDYFVITNVVATNGVITFITDVDGKSTVAPINGFELIGISGAGGGGTNGTPTFSNLANHTVNYGTTSVALSGTVGGNGQYLPQGIPVIVTVDGNTQQTSIDDSTGDFTINYNTLGILVSSTPYTVTYKTPGADNFNAATNTSTTLTIHQLPLVLNGLMSSNGTTTVSVSELSISNDVGSDNLTLSGNVTIASPDVGTEQITSFSGLTLGGLAAANYTLTGASGSVTVISSILTTNLAYGVHFLGNTADPVTGSAGVVPMTRWNNVANGNIGSGSSVNIYTSDGSEAATLTLSGTGANLCYNSGTTGNGGDTSLMDGYMDNGWFTSLENTAIAVSGLKAGQSFDVYIYCFGNLCDPNGANGYLPSFAVNGTAYYVPTIGSGGTGYCSGSGLTSGSFANTGYVRGTTFTSDFGTPVPSSADYGDYILIPNVVATNGQITIQTDVDGQPFRCSMNGFELVPIGSGVGVTNVNPQFSGLSSAVTNYGTLNVPLSGMVSAGGSYPPAGTVITASVNGNQQQTTIYNSTGGFSLSYNTAGIPASATPYTVTYTSPNTLGFNGVTNTSTTMTIHQLPVSLSGTMVYNGSTTVPAADLYLADLIGNDNLTLSGSVTVSSASVGVETVASVSGLSLGGTAAANYTLTGAGGSVMITSTGSYTNFNIIPFLRTASATELVVYFHDTNWSGPVWAEVYSTNTYNTANPSAWTLNGTAATALSEFVTEGDQGSDYHIYMQVPPMTNGGSYTLSTPYGGTNFVFNDHQILCESIKVNQNGYSALSQTRYADFGIWLGTAGSEPISGPLPTYSVFNQTNGQLVAWGALQAVTNSQPDSSSGDYVYRINLSSVPAGGPYQVAVTGYGCSYPFGVGGNFSSRLGYVAFRGLYYQWSGCPITQPYAWANLRPTPDHTNNLFDDEYPDQSFVNNGPASTNGAQLFTHGGYHDASDPLHYAYHLAVSVIMMATYEVFPHDFTSNQFNIPAGFTSNYTVAVPSNGIPDILNEANWGLMFFTNVQSTPGEPVGAIPFGDNGNPGGPPWGSNMDADTTIYGTITNVGWDIGLASGAFMNYARLIQPYNPSLSTVYSNDAVAAYSAYIAGGRLNSQETLYYNIQDYLLSGNTTASNYIEANYTETSTFPTTYNYEPGGLAAVGGRWMAPYFMSYIVATNRPTDTNIVAYFKSVVQQAADNEVGYVTNGAYPCGWPTYDNPNIDYDYHAGSFTSQGQLAYPCLMEWALTGTQKYIDAVSQLMDYDQGLNPLGKCYMTGIGFNRVYNPEMNEGGIYAEDQGWGGPAPGATVYGPGTTQQAAGQNTSNAVQIPNANNLPRERIYVDDLGNSQWGEYTISQNVDWPAAIYEVLAQGAIWRPTNGSPFIVNQATNQVY